MGFKSRRTSSALGAPVEPMERRLMMAAHTVARSAIVNRLGESLSSVYTEYQTIKAKQTAASAKMSASVKAAAASVIPALTAAAFDMTGSSLNVSDDGVQLDAYAVKAADAKSLAASIKKLGGTGIQTSGLEVDAVVPASALSTLSKLKTLKFAEPADYVVNAGSVTSQGDVADRASVARATTGLTGSGVIVGIISDSFNNAATSLGYTDSENTDESSGDLPANVSVLQEDSLPATDEGRAIAQVIYDSAPGVQIDFYSGASGPQAIANGITDLQQLGAKVIINDITQLTEPMFEDGVAAQAAETAIAAGVTFISAAGNAGTDGYGATWTNDEYLAPNFITSTSISNQDLDYPFYGGETYNFAPAGQTPSDTDSFSLAGGATMKVSFQWEQPYYSVTNSVGNADQVDIYILENIGGQQTVVGGGADYVIGRDPIQDFQFYNPGAVGTTGTFSVMLVTEPGSNAPSYFKFVDLSNTSTGWQYTASSPNNGTIFGTANAAGAIAVGAVNYKSTPANGVSTPVIEPYSSVGGTPIFYDNSGNQIAATYRQQPLVTGPDGVATTFFGPVSASTSLHVFSGTSAAAASVAGIAALMIQEAPSSTPAQIASALDSTALSFGTAVPNYTSGYGFVRADSATAVLVGTVSGTVYSDNNTDGALDNAEPGIGGVTVYIDANKTGVYNSHDLTTVTAPNGTFSFANVPTGSVVVGLVVPGGYIAITATSTATVVGAATTAGINLGLFPTSFNSTTGGVSASVIVDPTVSSKLDITVGSTSYRVTKTLLSSIGFILSGGNNTLTLNFSNGNPTPANGFQYTASGANNSFVFNGTTGNDAASVSGNYTSFDSSPNDTSSGVANEIFNGLGGNDSFYVYGTPAATTLTVNGGLGNDTLNLNTALPNGGSDVVFNAGTNAADNNTFNVNTGSYTFLTDPSVTSSNLTVNVNTSSSVLFAAGALGSGFNQRKIAALNLGASTTATLVAPVTHADRTVLVTGTLSMAASALLDMTGNDMIVTSGSLTTINNLVAGNFDFAGSFNTSTGITSTTAKADTTHSTAVGVISNNQSGSAIYGSSNPFDGQTSIPLNAVLLKYTYIGDTNLDGKVDGSDYSNIDAGYSSGKTGWFNGDIDYDGIVDGSDYSYMDNVFNSQGAPL